MLNHRVIGVDDEGIDDVINLKKSKYCTGMILPIVDKHHRYVALNLRLVQGNITGIYMCVMTFG